MEAKLPPVMTAKVHNIQVHVVILSPRQEFDRVPGRTRNRFKMEAERTSLPGIIYSMARLRQPVEALNTHTGNKCMTSGSHKSQTHYRKNN
jgi:hypothetical protein